MNLTATAENGRARIELKGTISKWRETEAEFTSKVEELIKSGVKDVHIYINSPGGECFEANEIVNVIKRFPGKITGEGGALVASAATYIAINCTSFSMPANGLFMIHQVSGGACGKVADIESTLEVMRKLNEHYLNAFLSKCTDKKKIKDAWDNGDHLCRSLINLCLARYFRHKAVFLCFLCTHPIVTIVPCVFDFFLVGTL